MSDQLNSWCRVDHLSRQRLPEMESWDWTCPVIRLHVHLDWNKEHTARLSRVASSAALGIEGGEIMTQIQLAMMGKLPYTILKGGIFAHPTLAESLNNLFNHFEKLV